MEKWKLNALFQKSDLAKFLEMKIERYVGEMFWLQNVGKLQIDENQNLDEITMTGEFGVEINIVKEWIKEWKTLKFKKSSME